MQATAVILAAGLGTRMKSALPKTLHRIAGRSMLRHLLASCEQVFDRIVVVVGPDMEAVQREAAPAHLRGAAGTAGHRACRAGRGRAVRRRRGGGAVRRQPADPPRHAAPAAAATPMHATPAWRCSRSVRPIPGSYGRVIARHGFVERIVEWADAGDEVRAIDLCNAGVLCAAAADMRRWLQGCAPRQCQGRILSHRCCRTGGARTGGASPRWRRRPRSSPASIRAPNWRRRRRWCSPGCARRRWRPG